MLVAATAAELQQLLQQPALLLTCSRSCHSRKTLQPSLRATLSRYLQVGRWRGATAQALKRRGAAAQAWRRRRAAGLKA